MQVDEMVDDDPERMLWVNVLWVAIKDVARDDVSMVRDCNRREVSRNRENAKEWFLSQEDEEGSFRWVCLILGLDPDWVHRWVSGFMKSPRKKEISRRWRNYQ